MIYIIVTVWVGVELMPWSDVQEGIEISVLGVSSTNTYLGCVNMYVYLHRHSNNSVCRGILIVQPFQII